MNYDDKTKEAQANETEVLPKNEKAIGFLQALAIPVSHRFVIFRSEWYLFDYV